MANNHRSYSGEVFADLKKLAAEVKDAELAKLFTPSACTDAEAERKWRGGLEQLLVLPDTFVVSDRGPYFDPNAANKGRPLTAGFHLMQGYFRDDGPLYELILDDRGRRGGCGMWVELNFIAARCRCGSTRISSSSRAGPPRLAEASSGYAPDQAANSAAKMERLAKMYWRDAA